MTKRGEGGGGGGGEYSFKIFLNLGTLVLCFGREKGLKASCGRWEQKKRANLTPHPPPPHHTTYRYTHLYMLNSKHSHRFQ